METATQPPDETPDEKGEEKEQAVPYNRFKEVNDRLKDIQSEAEEWRKKAQEFEDANRSETERERVARERAEAQVGELQTQLTGLQKGTWVRSAAAEMNFHDPEDAVIYLSDKLAGLEDERDAKREVKRLAERKEHLLRQEEKKRDERPAIGRVLTGPDTAQNAAPGQPLSQAQLAADQDRRSAEGLAAELKKFTDNWHQLGE